MTYTFTRGQYANPENTAAIVTTLEAGDIAASALDTPELWAAFLASGAPLHDYVAPLPPVPVAVTAAQAKIALERAGILSTVEGLIATMAAAGNREPKLWFENAGIWERNNSYVIALASQVGLMESDIDDLFHAAAAVV